MGNGREMGRRAEKVRETEVRNRNWGSNEWKRGREYRRDRDMGN